MNLNIQQIKLFIKTSIIIGVLAVFVVLGIFVRPTITSENARMEKWLRLNETQRISTIQHVIKDFDGNEILVKCVDKIAQLPNSNEMLIRDAIVLCNGGIQMNLESSNDAE
ncbi:MAG: hypothetical protein IK122_03125 [Alphaproteobacteria bacterium]|nr:hypothetical protein [Alphaproteobacteria bacterium]